MIYTVTLNPSIDYVISLKQMNLGLVNRLEHATKFPGGKGINVSRILNENNVDNTALGFLGGFTGKYVSDKLDDLTVKHNFIEISDDTRINVKIHAEEETELNAAGPNITDSELQQFKDQFNKIKSGDIVIFSGSIPVNLPQTLYKDLIAIITQNGAEFVVDTTGQGLLDTLKYHPLVVKPNNHELADLFNVKLKSNADIIKYAKQIIDLGAQNVMISMAGAGGILVTSNAVYRSTAPQGQVINSVGAGDSMLAGFVGEYTKNKNLSSAFKRGLACGSATAFSLDIAKRNLIDQIFSEIKIEEI